MTELPCFHTISQHTWRLESLGHPSAAHAADAVEIVAGEVVRRIALPQEDYAVLQAVRRLAPPAFRPLPYARDIVGHTPLSLPQVERALTRLMALGLLPGEPQAPLQ